jgi:hypothetical protein
MGWLSAKEVFREGAGRRWLIEALEGSAHIRVPLRRKDQPWRFDLSTVVGRLRVNRAGLPT